MKFKKTKTEHKPAYRPVQQVSLSCHVKGGALPHPDLTDPESCLLGQNRRVCFEPPVKKRKIVRRFEKFVRNWCKKNLVPLSYDLSVDIDFWLSLTNYPEWRKQQLREAWSLIDGILEKRHFVVNNFIKDETYPEYKHLRGINARTDAFKVAVGPIFKLIEKAVFANPWFIKKVPVPERAKFIYDLVHGEMLDYYGTDHTSFEGHFSKEVMEACEFVLYDYMTQYSFGGKDFSDLIHNVLGGENFITSKWFSYSILATRMTGEMCTSLGNGFTNLMLLLFMAEESHVQIKGGVVEGDDSVFSVRKGAILKTHIFKDLGFNIKMEKFENVHTASFCGNVFWPGDFYTVTNPIDILLAFGWTTSRYKHSKSAKLKELLRSKSLSVIYEYRACPIAKALGYYGKRMTEGYRARSGVLNEYQREEEQMRLEDMKKNKLPDIEIPIGTRQLVEDLYGITIQAQIMYENYLDNLTELEPLNFDLLDNFLHDHQRHYYLNYVLPVNPKENIDIPNISDVSRVIWNEDYMRRVNLTRSAYMLT
jgi:hypothetical protein